MIFGEIDSFISLLERIFKLRKKKYVTTQPNLISTRIVNIFEAHGVHRNQIPRVIESGLTLYDVRTDEHLLRKLNYEIIQKTSDILGIKRNWLVGASESIYPTYDFYKDPYSFCQFVENKKKMNPDGINGLLLSPNKKDNANAALLIIQETIGCIDGDPYYRYYLCNNWDFSYWKSRAYLTACISICWRNGIYIRGKSVQNELINSLAYGCNPLNFGSDGIYSIRGQPWYAEDMASSPDAFLNDLDPEQEKYGIKSGLTLWLELHNKGLMNYGIEDKKARNRFIEELNKHAQ